MTYNTLKFAAACAFLLLLFPPAMAGQWPELELKRDIPATKAAGAQVAIAKDPVYQTGKRFLAYPLRPLIRMLGKRFAGDPQQAVLVFTAVDGYKVSMAYADALAEDGYLAYRDLDAAQGDWIAFEFGRERITPGPFYLVWSKPGIDKWRYPWPFQLQRIALQPVDVYYGRAAPLDQSASVGAGFAEFTRYCIRCHAVNGSGGQVGPELNSPGNVTGLYSDATLRELILDNPKYRPNSKMPVFSGLLNDRQVDGILAYLKSMAAHKITVDEND